MKNKNVVFIALGLDGSMKGSDIEKTRNALASIQPLGLVITGPNINLPAETHYTAECITSPSDKEESVKIKTFASLHDLYFYEGIDTFLSKDRLTSRTVSAMPIPDELVSLLVTEKSEIAHSILNHDGNICVIGNFVAINCIALRFAKMARLPFGNRSFLNPGELLFATSTEKSKWNGWNGCHKVIL